MLESSFQTLVIKYLENKGAYVRKYIASPGSIVGTPDLLVCYKGIFIGIELKSGTPTTVAQILNLQRIKQSGGKAFVLNYSSDWKNALDKELEHE